MDISTKPQIKRYIENSQLAGVMSSSKWDRLFTVLESSNLELLFRRKNLGGEEPAEQEWDGDIYHVFGTAEKIEWLEIYPVGEFNAEGIPVQNIERGSELLFSALKSANTPYTMQKQAVRVWGYIPVGSSKKWAHT